MRPLPKITLHLIILVLLAGILTACSPYRVHKRTPKNGRTQAPSFFDFKRNCNCN